jgi:hypothetical protein
MINKDQAINKLMYAKIDDLRETCYYAHKDHYGMKGHHLLSASKGDLVSWWVSLYDFDENKQYWVPKVPFEEEVKNG